MASKPTLPMVGPDGALMAHAGKRSAMLVQDAFEMIGGVQRFAQWADENPGDFYTKLFSKTITRESDVNVQVGVENMLDELQDAEAQGMILDAEFTDVED